MPIELRAIKIVETIYDSYKKTIKEHDSKNYEIFEKIVGKFIELYPKTLRKLYPYLWKYVCVYKFFDLIDEKIMHDDENSVVGTMVTNIVDFENDTLHLKFLKNNSIAKEIKSKLFVEYEHVKKNEDIDFSKDTTEQYYEKNEAKVNDYIYIKSISILIFNYTVKIFFTEKLKTNSDKIQSYVTGFVNAVNKTLNRDNNDKHIMRYNSNSILPTYKETFSTKEFDSTTYINIHDRIGKIGFEDETILQKDNMQAISDNYLKLLDFDISKYEKSQKNLYLPELINIPASSGIKPEENNELYFWEKKNLSNNIDLNVCFSNTQSNFNIDIQYYNPINLVFSNIDKQSGSYEENIDQMYEELTNVLYTKKIYILDEHNWQHIMHMMRDILFMKETTMSYTNYRFIRDKLDDERLFNTPKLLEIITKNYDFVINNDNIYNLRTYYYSKNTIVDIKNLVINKKLTTEIDKCKAENKQYFIIEGTQNITKNVVKSIHEDVDYHHKFDHFIYEKTSNPIYIVLDTKSKYIYYYDPYDHNKHFTNTIFYYDNFFDVLISKYFIDATNKYFMKNDYFMKNNYKVITFNKNNLIFDKKLIIKKLKNNHDSYTNTLINNKLWDILLVFLISINENKELTDILEFYKYLYTKNIKKLETLIISFSHYLTQVLEGKLSYIPVKVYKISDLNSEMELPTINQITENTSERIQGIINRFVTGIYGYGKLIDKQIKFVDI